MMSDHAQLLTELCPQLQDIARAEAARGNYLRGACSAEDAEGLAWVRFSLEFRFHENYAWRGKGLTKHINKDIHDWYVEYACKASQQTLMCPQARLQDAVDREG